MFSEDTEKIKQLQADILLENLNANPYFTRSSIASKNKALNTVKQHIVAAINEILAKNESVGASANTSVAQVAFVVGDTLTNVSLLADLHSVGDNLIAAVKSLDNRLKAMESMTKRVCGYTQTIDVMEEQSVFSLDYVPCSNILFFVNGFLYSLNKEYTYDQEGNFITWTFRDNEAGFCITDAVVQIIYDYMPIENQESGDENSKRG